MAAPECGDDLDGQSRGFGRCGLCGACTQRGSHHTPPWQKSFVSFELAGAVASRGGRHAIGGVSERHYRHSGGGDEHPGRIPAVIISGCDSRYERAAMVARAAGFAPTWLVGVFRQNVAARPGCVWPSANERNLLHAHRNAWSLIASSNVSMAVIEDDIEMITGAAAIRKDVLACETSYRAADTRGVPCQLLYLGLVDAYWATHALYITPAAARQLLRASRRPCPEPTDYHTHRMCLAPSTERLASWHVARELAAHCRAFSHVAREESEPRRLSSVSSRRQSHVLDGPSPRGPIRQMRPAELYGMGHLVQNRTRGYIHKLKGFDVVDEKGDGQGANC